MTTSHNVWILQTGEPLPSDAGEPRPMRAMNLAAALAAAGHRVVLWSSDFYHQEKRHRTGMQTSIRVSDHLEVRLIPSPGYSANIGPGRLYDHAVLARNLRKALEATRERPDVGFIGYPPIETAAVMTKWLAARGIPSLLDVKDQWPTLFLDPMPAVARPVGRVMLTPYFAMAKSTMRNATGISAMADGFLRWATDFAGRPRNSADIVVPLTSPDDPAAPAAVADARGWWDTQGVKADGRTRVSFVGSHSRAFDFAPIADAARRDPACSFVICGHGEMTPQWKAAAAGLSNVIFAGWVDRARIHVLAERSSAMLAPYRISDDFAMSIPNKILDALSFGLPILSPLEGEVALLIERCKVGLRYGGATNGSLSDAISRLKDISLQEEMCLSARATYLSDFSFDQVYGRLVSHLEALARESPRGRAPE